MEKGESHIWMGEGKMTITWASRNRCCLPIILRSSLQSVPVRARGGEGEGGAYEALSFLSFPVGPKLFLLLLPFPSS